MRSLGLAILLTVSVGAATEGAAGATTAAGTLVVRSQPGAEVAWDGVAIGTTDARGELSVDAIPPGTYSILLRKDGFRPLERNVVVGAESTVLALPLVPLGSVAPRGTARQPTQSAATVADREPAWRLAAFVLTAAGIAALLALGLRARPRRRRRRHRTPPAIEPLTDAGGDRQPGHHPFLAEIGQRERHLRGDVLATVPPAAGDVVEGEILDPGGEEEA
ncbi:MAG TPA: PEGA domain-containing protein [Thermoanaerobaculia bacterium]|jgi:hypothetical protein|nr:PEGA domain-containing protein [Thermoanaerobaculia bacterium]